MALRGEFTDSAAVQVDMTAPRGVAGGIYCPCGGAATSLQTRLGGPLSVATLGDSYLTAQLESIDRVYLSPLAI